MNRKIDWIIRLSFADKVFLISLPILLFKFHVFQL